MKVALSGADGGGERLIADKAARGLIVRPA